MIATCELALLICFVAQAGNQRIADWADFTRSPTEHEITFLEPPFIIRSVEGETILGPYENRPIASVLFEIQGPGTASGIRRTKTDENGRFKFSHVSSGTYRFKTTLDGFKSVAGTIVVSKGAEREKRIRIEIQAGN